MKCPYCGSFCADKTLYCPNCKQPLPTADPTKPKEAPVAPPKSRKAVLRRVGMAAVTVVSLCALGIAAVCILGRYGPGYDPVAFYYNRF